MTFPSISPALDRALAARGYATPTAVQLAVLDQTALDRDLLVSAQTGSGKTVAFGLAMAATLLGGAERFERAASPLALIIAPTRELAMQVQRELVWLYAETGARIVACVGGMDARAEGRQLESGAHIVVGTPGRLRDHIERRRLVLGGLKAVVLDEADEMLDLGFREDLEFILETTPTERRTLLFSATLPRDIEALARRYQRDAVRIETIRRDEQHADIDYRAIAVAANDVEKAIVNVLRYYDPRASLVFCSTRQAVKRLQARLAERGFAAVALSGELDQEERTQALAAVRHGRARVLVATDVAARGIDLPDLALVVHAELPNDQETLLHRSGRTGRAGKKGLCVLVVPYSRRRKAEALLGAARLTATWGAAPTAEDIHTRDRERFLADPIFTEAATEDETALARELAAGRSPDDLALALVRLHRARLPSPEDLATGGGYRPEDARRPSDVDRRAGRGRNDDRSVRGDRPRRSFDNAADRSTSRGADHGRPRRDGDREMVWFRLDIGHERNADPRWILPLICKAGDVSRSEIGAIKIGARETRFEIAADHADDFTDAVRGNRHKEGNITRIGGADGPEDADRPRAASDAQRAGEQQPARTQRKPWHERSAPHSGHRGSSHRGDHKPRGHDRAAGHSAGKSADTGRPVSKYKQKRKQRAADAR